MAARPATARAGLRVLTVGNMYPPHHRGGYELVWESAVGHLEAQGHAVRVLTSDHRERLPQRDSVADDRAVRALRWYWSHDSWPEIPPLERVRIERHNLRTLRREITDFQPDVVCWWAMGGMSLSMIETARRLGVAEAFVLCDDWLVYGPRVDGWTRGTARLGPLQTLVQMATGVPTELRRSRPGPALCPSRWLSERARQKGWEFTSSSIVGQGVPRSLFPEAPTRPWQWDIACVGRLDERKGVDLAIGALAHLPNEARLRIIGSDGDAEYRDELVRLIEVIGVADRVEFDSLPRNELGAAYAAADVVVFPVRWPEPWGLVPLESMSVGRPVIASGRGGSGEYLEDGRNCVLFDPDDGAGALADAILSVATEPETRNRLREGGFATAASFGESDFDRAVESLVSEAAALARPSDGQSTGRR